MTLKRNIEHVLTRVKDATSTSNQELNDIQLIAVTKTIDVNVIKEAINLGVLHIGENKVQELTRKYEEIGDIVKWHLIGHLQRNKVKYIIDKVDLIHSLDSLRLAKEINKRAKNIDRIMECLLQVNVSGETTKHGVDPKDVKNFLKEIAPLDNIKIVGLMTMAPHVENKEESRQYFKKLKEMYEEISDMNLQNIEMKYLSMGMSNDYEIAVEEGANIIRVGRSIFGERDYSK